MNKTLLAITMAAVFTLVGCQDEKQKESTATDVPQATEVETTIDATPIEEEQVITTETFVDSAHNAQNALDWNGTYTGKLPCADCASIDTTLTLNPDGSYTLVQIYKGKEDGEFKSEGQFTWNESGNTITLVDEAAPNQYFVGENMLMKLDMNGEKATGELASFYNLSKMP
ncbi:copper resistance protein NlpE [Vibrio rotiferianus]|uniref:copper resistance protein NlpE n=1 Tax=Vibrio rotiferianus TaxID=190895 RepID=UPI001110A2DE|nr:copper resistance protein NlpE [Vibrio rotiferianus]TMX42613.1 copper resistance protein NlpE [Vibrio rotiferianus]TMX56336.1 copper resistance protein NlpE [Vibrio rotiferianus]TMX68486.1 copper resistance protein NlpE [Vibrio rotiferianus]